MRTNEVIPIILGDGELNAATIVPPAPALAIRGLNLIANCIGAVS